MPKVTIFMVMQASVAQAKSQLADLLRRAERGEEVVIARHGLPVARLVAIQRPGPPPVSAKPLDPKLYQDIDLDEPAFPSWEKGGHASLD
jgi:prevent-host-death family protein